MDRVIDMDNFIYIDTNLCLSVNIRFFKKQKNYEEFIRYIFNVIDNILLIRKQKLDVDTMNVYVDLKDYKIKEIDYDFIKLMIHVCEGKYPDNLNIINIKNANIMIKTIYSILRPFIHKDTRKKIFFIKKNKKNKNELNVKANDDQLQVNDEHIQVNDEHIQLNDEHIQVNEENIDELFDV
jgi:hypothetical protein